MDTASALYDDLERILVTREEIQKLLQSCEDGLVFFNGQWVEIDKEKLSQALAFWGVVQEQAENKTANEAAKADMMRFKYIYSIRRPGVSAFTTSQAVVITLIWTPPPKRMVI